MSSFSLAVSACLITLLCCLSALTVSADGESHPLSLVRLDKISRRHDAGVIRIDAKSLRGMGETVNVSFSALSSHYPGDDDWIGVWSLRPADGNYSTTAPVKYKFVTPDAAGSGNVELWMLNARESVVVAYFTGGLSAPVLLAESAAVDFENVALPMHIHLALTNDHTQMRVDWTSAQDGSSGPWLHFGAAHNNLTGVAHVTTTTYAASDMCGGHATGVGFRAPGFLHSALLDGLEPNTEYLYQVGDTTLGSESEVINFWSAPRPDAVDAQFVIFGDLGEGQLDGSNQPIPNMPHSLLTTRALEKDIKLGTVNLSASAAVFHIGDISYARGFVSSWEQFFYQISAISPHLPWMIVDGNHERDWPGSGSGLYNNHTDSGGECGVAIARRFHMPNPEIVLPFDQTWWSLDFGPVHFIVMSTEHFFNQTSLQYLWIQKDLEAVDRSKTPFIVFAGHRPMYTATGNDKGPDQLALLGALEPLLLKYQVDVAFWGHVHNYQRTCAVANYTCVDNGIVHIVTGAAGAKVGGELVQPLPHWLAFHNTTKYGYINAHIKQRRTMTLDFINAHTNEIMDSVTLKNRFLHEKNPPIQQ